MCASQKVRTLLETLRFEFQFGHMYILTTKVLFTNLTNNQVSMELNFFSCLLKIYHCSLQPILS